MVDGVGVGVMNGWGCHGLWFAAGDRGEDEMWCGGLVMSKRFR